MTLSYYLKLLARRWLYVVIGLAITVGLTLVFVDRQPLVYEARGTMVIRPRTVDLEDGVSAIDTLTRGVEIASTYATIARSKLILDRATNELGPTFDAADVSVSSEVLTLTSILEVSVTGGDPGVVHDAASAIVSETARYVGELQNVYELQVIDEPVRPSSPIAPNRSLIIATGGVIGLGAGIAFAMLAEAVSVPVQQRRTRRLSHDRTYPWVAPETPRPRHASSQHD